MTFSSTSTRHLFVRLGASRLPDALQQTLRDEVVLAGYFRGGGALAEVEIAVLDPRTGSLAAPRALHGLFHAISVEGAIGMRSGDVSCGLRAVLSREGETGLETIAGEIVSARVVALEGVVTAFDDLAAERKLDPAGLWMTAIAAQSGPAPAPTGPLPTDTRDEPPAAVPAPAPPVAAAPPTPPPAQPSPPAAPPTPPPAQPSPPAAAPAPAAQPNPAPAPSAAQPRPSPTFSAPGGMPRPIRAVAKDDDEQLVPEEGDIVEHFAFGRCEVVKVDGDRLHVRLGKGGRVKEIALEMLNVSALEPEEGSTARRFRLSRRL